MRIRGPAFAVLSAAAIVAVGITSSISAHAEQTHLKQQVVIPAPAAIDQQQVQFVIPQAFDIVAITVKESGHFVATALGEQPYVDIEEAITHRMQAARIATDHASTYACQDPRGLQDGVAMSPATAEHAEHFAELASDLATIYGGPMTSFTATAAEPGIDHSALRGGIKDEVPESDFSGGIKFGQVAQAYTHQ